MRGVPIVFCKYNFPMMITNGNNTMPLKKGINIIDKLYTDKTLKIIHLQLNSKK